MTTNTASRSPVRWLPLVLALAGACSWAMAANLSHASRSGSATPEITGTILPYGTVAHVTAAASATILPYGAMGTDATIRPGTVLPYGAMNRETVTASAAVLPYGAAGIKAAP